MRRYQIVLFIFGVIAALAVLCAVFPEEGLWGLRFPQLSDILSAAEKDEGPSPEELIQLRRQAVLAAEKDQYQNYFREDPARFYVPGDDYTFFDELFAALDEAERTPLRIVHYGDSQIEEDRITGAIRERLQARFGGNGPGMMPARQHATPYVGGGSTAELARYFNYGDLSYRAGIRKYGPYADFVRLDTTATLSYYPIRGKSKAEQRTFERVTLVAGNLRSRLSVSSRGDKRTVEADGSPLAFVRFEMPDSSTRVSLTVSGYADLYGVLLDSKTGVRMDNMAMRGSSGAIFTTMDADQLRDFYREENVRLIMLQYGGNSVPYLKTDTQIATYVESIRKQIVLLRELAPQAKIVFVGPSDMSTVVSGKRQTYPKLPGIVDLLRENVLAAGGAYWDIFGVMGGENSMVQWVAARPQLAGSDYVHFTLAGSRKIGDMFCDALFVYYDYYQWRMKNGR
jgi:lysophospholipase L1-like esterase